MSPITNDEAHRLAREKGVSRPLYAVVRGVFVPFMRLYWGLRIADADKVPKEGPAIVTPNHKSFFDSFFLAVATKRHLRFMGKSELFEGRLGKTFVRLGAFPVRRGESDADALETARVYPGGCLIEGTNLSEGRGTTRPFEVFGAPWLDGRGLAARVSIAGAALRPLTFLPMFQKHARTTELGARRVRVQHIVEQAVVAGEDALVAHWRRVEPALHGVGQSGSARGLQPLADPLGSGKRTRVGVLQPEPAPQTSLDAPQPFQPARPAWLMLSVTRRPRQ